MSLFKADNVESGKIRLVYKICPMHGPIIKNSLFELIDNYKTWIYDLTNTSGKVAVFYASAYGNTAALAQVKLN